MTRREIAVAAGIVAVTFGLNAFLIGDLVGFHMHRHVSPQQRFENQLNAIWLPLPRDDQTAAREVIEKQRDDLLNKWWALRSSGRQAAAALHDPVFDEEAAKSAFARLNQAFSEYQIALQAMKIDIASKISEQGRRAMSFGPPRPRASLEWPNPAAAYSVRAMVERDFPGPDRIEPANFNRALWPSLKCDTPDPAPQKEAKD